MGTEGRVVVTRGWRVGEMGRCWSKVQTFSYTGGVSPGALLYSAVTAECSYRSTGYLDFAKRIDLVFLLHTHTHTGNSNYMR